ncbi:GDSL-type esterase/lipase family protein [Phytomonospora sp. NPDC050363]|uniref:GDSL-type esterase/lipase family protein n=1 Tax=Phytomonospora sp. NPDC050363 TaxID=3155642 RepID=UPI0033F5EB60
MVRRHGLLAALSAVLLLLGTTPAAAEEPVPFPASIAGLGDSISRGFNSCGWYFDCTARSWSTGDSDRVEGHYRRLSALNPAIEDNRHNNAETGATSADLAAQAAHTVEQRAEYVTVLIGANDACADSEAGMTSPRQYRTNVSAALSAIKRGLPETKVFIASIPDLYRLWLVNKDSAPARETWKNAGICRTMLGDPASTEPGVEQRRMNVRQRVLDYNTALGELCAEYGENCRFDGNAVFNTEFTADEVSRWDYFHPNVAGQRRLAEVTFAAAFDPR